MKHRINVILFGEYDDETEKLEVQLPKDQEKVNIRIGVLKSVQPKVK